ncbi:SCO family protein [Oceanobacillus halophilus]|uniref:SCO family protein n=1 Tax=Oceanobacillus halophilus TaxID=930130 RepID=A0A495ACL5_9BACI|nr:SCO family protein [Oceanobacillus halophilus]RKQ37334.1 SCO family protein [Oceanobacillus halophilus]
MKYGKLVVLGLILILVACGGYPIETNMSEDVANFEFTTQDNEKLSLSDLEGEWWIADFVFTNCTTVCLPMTANMSQLQNKIKEENLDVQLISFSVDPENDTPEVLKNYGESYEADFSSWTFLTGYDFETIKELSIKSFKNLVSEPPEGSNQVTHGTSFFLVSPEGEVVKNYSGVNSSEIPSIISDLKKINES